MESVRCKPPDGSRVRRMNSEPRAQQKSKMQKTTPKNSILVGVLLGTLVAGKAMPASIRYMNTCDYLNAAGCQGGVIPGSRDRARFNSCNNTVTLAGEAPLLTNFQME